MKQSATSTSELRRGIKSWQVTFIGLGGVIGSCYFLGLGALIRDMGPAVILAFAVVGVIVYGMMIAFAELLVNVPRKGSFIAYTNEFLGPVASVGIGWAFWFSWVCYVPSEAIAAAVVLNSLFPGNQTMYAAGTLLLLTVINLCSVNLFARVESALSITKVCAIVLFSVLAFGIWIGLWGSDGFLGGAVNFGTGDLLGELFPNGCAVVLTNMVTVLVTFQGTEIIGLAAAETQDPETAVPRACKSVSYRIVLLYIVPILLILLMFPTSAATLDGAVFSQVLHSYRLDFWAALMSGVVLVAAFSCANTGFYGTVRCLYGLSAEGLAPKTFGRLNRKGTPGNAALLTLGAMWIVLLVGLLAGDSSLYRHLLSVSGFTGTLAWIGIIAAQKKMRKRLAQNGYTPADLTAAVPNGQRWLTSFSLAAQSICLLLLLFGEGQLPVFAIACAAILLPAAVSIVLKKRGKLHPGGCDASERPFSELFPPR